MRDAWRLAVGTLTALRVPPPTAVDRRVAGRAMTIAPLAAIPLGVLVGLVAWAGRELEMDRLAVAFVAVGALALGSRALHLDGLSDVADGLTASYDRQHSLDVMKSGTAGPAGVATVVVVLGVQVAALSSVLLSDRGPVVAGFLVCVSRAALTITCAPGVPAARADGLAVTYAGTVPHLTAAIVWAVAIAASIGVFAFADWPVWQGPASVVVAGAVVAVVVWRCVRRFGGVTGDVFGASIEFALAAALLVAT